MMYYEMGRQYHAERIRSAAEQRRMDDELGMQAARMGRAWRRFTGRLAGPGRDTGRGHGGGGGLTEGLRARYAGQ